ncbi:MAG: hypothetical protein ACOC20_04255 [Oceanicaulis sp.]
MSAIPANLPEPEYTKLPPEGGARWHPYADLFPWMEDKAYRDLVEDVRKNGVIEPIVMYEGMILDGRNRYSAAREIGCDYPFVEYQGDDPLGFVIAKNLARRHLTESQRASVAARLAKMPQGRPAGKPANLPVYVSAESERPPELASAPMSQADAARALSISERSLRDAKSVHLNGAPELVAALDHGDASTSAAAAVAKLPKEEQAAVVAEGPKAIKAKAKELREAKAPEPAAAQPPAEPIDPERKKLARLTREALEDEVIGLRADLADAKRKLAERKAEIERLKGDLAAYHQDDMGRALGNAQRAARAAEGRMKEHQATAVRLDRQVKALKKENAELKARLENQLIDMD